LAVVNTILGDYDHWPKLTNAVRDATEEEEVPGRSTFKKVFQDGIKGEADYDRDGYVTGAELGLYLQPEP
jgi:hypothetical protein